MIKPIKILNDLITNLNHVVKVSNVVNNGDGTFTLTVENTYYLTINKIITINNVDYKIVDFELNSWIKIAGTITPNVTSFQINSPKFVHGTPKMVNVENSFNNDYPFIWLVEFTEVDYNNDYAVNLTAKLDLNLLFLTDINYEDWLIKDHYINAIYPMANEIDFIINALNKRKDLFADIDNYKVINHVNFGDYVTNKGYDSKILTDQLSGCQLKLTLPYVVDLCNKTEVTFCKPSVISVNGIELVTITGVNYNLQVLDQNNNQIGNRVGNHWNVNIPQITDNYLYQKTGQTISKFSNDDGFLKIGNGTIDFTKLSNPNKFGNFERFTDTLGAQNYSNKVIIDWRSFNGVTVYGWYKLWLPENQLIYHLQNAPYTRAGYNDWNLANFQQLISIFNASISVNNTAQGLMYYPFNWNTIPNTFNEGLNGINSISPNLFTSTFLLGNWFWMLTTSGRFAYTNWWNYDYAVLIREFTLTELGL